MAKTAVILLAEGFEEVEAIAPIDVLRRAGVRVTIAGVNDRMVKSSRGIGVQAETLLKDYKEMPDAIILPGGLPGVENRAKSGDVAEIVKAMNAAGKIIAAICAAPAAVLAPLGILDGKELELELGLRLQGDARVVLGGPDAGRQDLRPGARGS